MKTRSQLNDKRQEQKCEGKMKFKKIIRTVRLYFVLMLGFFFYLGSQFFALQMIQKIFSLE